ncbi:MAG: IPT/TIG domain-containing protein, partial [Blastocatellia bacterium]
MKPAEAAIKYSSFQAAPFQGCTVNCTATVPATGQSGAGISFQASATTTGCSSQPSYQWSFGDGTPNSSEQNPSHTYASAGTYTWTLTTTVGSGSTMIDTVAGGLGEGNPARQSPFATPSAIARDPQNRGVYVADSIGSGTLIRFINTGSSAVTIAGRAIAPGTVRAIAGGGQEIADNVPALAAELGGVTGLAVSGDGNLVYIASQIDAAVRAVNVSDSSQTVGTQTVGAGRIGTLVSNLGTQLGGVAVKASTGEVFLSDASSGANKVFRITPQGQSSAFAGNGSTSTQAEDPFQGGPAVNIPLLQPRAVTIAANGDVLIADTGHGRVIRVDGGGTATLVNQFTINQTNLNPYPSGIALFGGNAYVANGNQQTIVRVTGGVARIAGLLDPNSTRGLGISCDYSASSCGDGGPASGASFNMLGSTAAPPVAGIAGDASGLYVLDQGASGRGRIRYINLTGGPVNIAGTNVPAGAIETIGGAGLAAPYDGGLATGANFNTPTGVAVDGTGNLWISDTISAKLRYVNRASTAATIFSGTPAQQVVPAGGIVTVNKDVGGGPSDGVPVNQAAFESPQGLFITSQGVYIADSKSGPTVPQVISGRDTSLIRFINTTGANVTLFGGSSSPIVVPPGGIMKIAGGSENSVNGDGNFATNAKFIGASDVVVTANGTIYVADVGQKAVRKIDGSTGVVSSVGGLGAKQFTGLGLDAQGRLHVANYDDGTVLRENSAGSGTFSTIATALNKPRDVTVTSDGTAFVTVGLTATGGVNNHQIVQIPPGGPASVIGGSTAGFAGDGGPISAALFNISPSPLVVASSPTVLLPETVGIVANGMEVLFTDSNNNRVRRISPSISTCTRTGTITIQGNNPTPAIASLSPASANQNSGALTLTVNGSGFIPSSVVRWKGGDRATTFVNAMQVTAQITAADTQTAGAAAVTVFNPAPGGGASNAVNFNVVPPNPVPAVSAINPNTAAEGGAGFTATVNGSNFVNGSVVRWDGQNRQTVYVSATQLTAQVLANDLIGAGVAAVTVFNPTPGGGVSNPVNFTITSTQNPQPALTNITPSTTQAGAVAFTMAATGNNFVTASKVLWNGADLATTYVSATQLTAAVPANLVAAPNSAQVTVFNPTPGGGSSAPLIFTVNPVGQNNPTIAGLNPASVAVGGPAFNLTVTGANYISGSKVRIGTSERATTFVSATQLTAAILASDIATAGSYNVTVINPGNSAASNVVKLEVAANVASVSAASFLGQSIAAESIVAAFGVGMATGVEVATTTPLPT